MTEQQLKKYLQNFKGLSIEDEGIQFIPERYLSNGTGNPVFDQDFRSEFPAPSRGLQFEEILGVLKKLILRVYPGFPEVENGEFVRVEFELRDKFVITINIREAGKQLFIRDQKISKYKQKKMITEMFTGLIRNWEIEIENVKKIYYIETTFNDQGAYVWDKNNA